MPNLWTHMIFGQEVLKRTGHDAWLEDDGARQLFQLGSQGPDPLFYHHYLPWKKDKRMNALGELMHEERCGFFLMDMLRLLQGKRNGSAGIYYAAGFLLHHILDRNAHPYIFAKSGFKKWNHQRFEIILDTLCARRFRGIETWRTPVWRLLWAGEQLPLEIAELMDALAAAHYPEAYRGLGIPQWQEAYRDMIAALKLFHDPYGVKRLLTARRIEPFVYKRQFPPLDYCNEAGTSWRDPTDQELVRTTGFWDHWEDALQEGERILPLALDCVRGTGEEAPGSGPQEALWIELERLLGNVSYSTGRPCGEFEIRYADPIL